MGQLIRSQQPFRLNQFAEGLSSRNFFSLWHRLIFQNLLMEANPAVLSSSETAWTSLLAAAAPDTLKTAASPQLTATLFNLACAPTGHVLAAKDLLRFAMPAGSDALLPASSRPEAGKHVVGGEEGFDTAKMRLAAAGALGQLACKFAMSGVLAHRPYSHKSPIGCAFSYVENL